jgi:group I intron endonuclease
MKEIVSGIYEIRNAVNGHFYIGSAVDIYNRRRQHFGFLRNGNHVNKHLQNAWNKHGEDCFSFSIIEYCNPEKLIEREQFYIDTRKPEYNITPNAGSQLGYRHTEEARKKVSVAGMGRVPTAEAKINMSASHMGRIFSEETRKKISQSQIGKIISLATRIKMSLSANGRKHSEETKRKISQISRNISNETRAKLSLAHKGYKHTEEAKEKMRAVAPWSGKTLSLEHKEKLSESHKGKVVSEETKEKMSIAQFERWKRKKDNE